MARFHFDLTHLRDTQGLWVVLRGVEYGLEVHDAATLEVAHRENAALGALGTPLTPGGTAGPGLSHFADVDDRQLNVDEVGFVQVIRHTAEDVHLDDVVAMAICFPRHVLQAHYQRSLPRAWQPGESQWAPRRAAVAQRRGLLSGKLNWIGVDQASGLPAGPESLVRLLVESHQVVTTIDTAAALVAHHPELASVRPYTAALVHSEHILPGKEVEPDQYNAMQLLAREIERAGDGWSKTVKCTDGNHNNVTAEVAVGDFQAGQQLYTYQLASRVLNAAKVASLQARRTAADDPLLRNKLWAPTPGITTVRQDTGASSTATITTRNTGTRAVAAKAVPRPGGLAGPAYEWTVKERTNHHGIDVTGLVVDGNDRFCIDAHNSYLRTLYAGYQLYDSAGKMKGDLTTLRSVSATDSLLGIPIPTTPTSLSFDLQGASEIELLFGSLGTTDWESEVSTSGALLTGLWQYGLPIAFMAAGAVIKNSGILKKILADSDLTVAAIGIGLPLVGGGFATGAALGLSKKMILALGNFVLCLATKKGLEKLGQYLVIELGAAAFTKAFGPVGWALQLISAGIDAVDLAVTTGEVLSSPACVRVRITRALDIVLTLKPDSRHGEAGHPETAVWPSVARRYQVTLQYKDGTSQELTGTLPAITSSAPLRLTFKSVPAGGQCRIVAGVYSDNGWLAGSWQSDWTTAKPNKDSTLDLGEHTITERLVPLSGDTQYVHKERLAETGGRLVWQRGKPADTTRGALDCGDLGTLCELVGMSISNTAFQVGYSWRASGQNAHPDRRTQPASQQQLYRVQNVSVLADPGSRLQSSDIGFIQRPAVAYSSVPNPADPKQIDPNNFVLDPRDGGMHLRQVLLGEGYDGMGLAQASPRSWGRFPLGTVDALTVHRSGMVVGCSWKEHKLALLELPAAALDDDKAPTALLVSGQGLRQGLLQGPKALSVTPDGRILVLESVNKRVQAFDTKGNPVPSFTPLGALFTLTTAEIAKDLDSGQVPDAFQRALEHSGLWKAGELTDLGLTALLDSGKITADDALDKAMAALCIELAFDKDHSADPNQSTQLNVVRQGESWLITDPRNRSWHVAAGDGTLTVYPRVGPAEIRAEKLGEQWLITDRGSGQAWRLAPSTAEPGSTLVLDCLSYFPLKSGNEAVQYLDLAVENRGYVYVLSHLNQGLDPADYLLDVYGPDGSFVCRTPDRNVTTHPQNIVAGKIVVDEFRNLFALNFETLTRAGQGPQPALASWEPTPPLFDLPLTKQRFFNERNIGEVVNAFQCKGVTLSPTALITINNREGSWSVKDGSTIYHVYRSGDGLQVYSVPA